MQVPATSERYRPCAHGRSGVAMVKLLAVFALSFCACNAVAQCPTIGSLCAGVAEANADDFWAKWNAADAVVYGMPVVAPGCIPPETIVMVGSYDGPQSNSCSFILAVSETWKGANALGGITVETRWMHDWIWDWGPPIPGLVMYAQEPCALPVALFAPAVYFLRSVDGQWETYMCFGTGVYDHAWLVSQVGIPLPVETVTWGGVKATYRLTRACSRRSRLSRRLLRRRRASRLRC
jgi:hypothetical protein